MKRWLRMKLITDKHYKIFAKKEIALDNLTHMMWLHILSLECMCKNCTSIKKWNELKFPHTTKVKGYQLVTF